MKSKLLEVIGKRLASGIPEISGQRAWEEARDIVEHVQALRQGEHVFRGIHVTSLEETIDRLVDVRIEEQVPVAYITGYAHFWMQKYKVTPDVLIPRPCSEILVETAVKTLGQNNANSPGVLDLGTGSGCLLLSTLCEVQSANGVGVDISAGALKFAKANAGSLGLGDRCTFLQANFMHVEELEVALGNWAFDQNLAAFSAVLCNPPYITKEEMGELSRTVRDFEPNSALYGGPDGLDCYRQVAKRVKGLKNRNLIEPGANVIIEAGAGQAQSIVEIFEEIGITDRNIAKDLAGIDRCVVVQV
uniref:Methyltransferase domain-containing protein n=1 Tax=Mucochytrium quahogii TaxID=96639 RepID=A0A7S2RUA0_9STRA|mmetsp:Transcript_5732/g.8904  ORF Transcript_5732/g.8904 Transcript_5732/m.8904 type:complete len:303 (+) Transcript_5732:483-1391(+)|eukprot:CAMPEP_0203743688 /NCGR_PEP_ID=MMETSP0098-20131031/14_1 /ASSEMBLY_ACC=CAM_ASM_000208 /TAXON_ID=96639 /ORGANISM=" , Strain NY0313808BC1" /LENGTH=302 /DNA_ID=CAMNT_0050631003 /DNA_START=360 /DNA_END=1268 /DNA_ORIENTATION=+